MTAELGDFIEAAGLLEYDPAAITRIYAGHPQRLIRRLWQTLVPIGLLLLGVAFDWIFQQLKDETRARARARPRARPRAPPRPRPSARRRRSSTSASSPGSRASSWSVCARRSTPSRR